MSGMAGIWRAAALGAACVLGVPTIAMGQAAKAGVVTTLQGTATVARASAPQPAPLRFKDDVFIRDHIVTGDSSIVRILLGGKAVVTVRERSALTIHETPTTSTIELSSGKIALAVTRGRMKQGDSVQIKTPNAMAGVRGTVVIADVAPPAEVGGSTTTRFTLLTGIVDVARLDPSTGQPTGRPATLQPLQTIVVSGNTPPGAVRTISPSEAQTIASDYKVSLPAPPPAANTDVTERQIELAVQHSAALTDGPSVVGEGASGALERALIGAGNPRLTNGGVSANGGATAIGGGISAGSTISAGGTVSAGGGGIAAGGSVSVGGGGVAVGGGVGVGGIGVGAGVTTGGIMNIAPRLPGL